VRVTNFNSFVELEGKCIRNKDIKNKGSWVVLLPNAQVQKRPAREPYLRLVVVGRFWTCAFGWKKQLKDIF